MMSELATYRATLARIDLLIRVRGSMDPQILLEEIHAIVQKTLDPKIGAA